MDREIEHVDQALLQQHLAEDTMAQNDESPPSCCSSLVTSAATSPRMMVELFHSAISSFDEKTYFRIALRRAAYGWAPSIPGNTFANLSYVVRPHSIASQAVKRPRASRR